MAEDYYGLPIKFSDIFKKKQLRKVDIYESICFNIRLILTSHFGENRFDETYGCEVWERDFEIVVSDNFWKEQLSQSIQATISKHEKRLLNVKVQANVGEEEFKSGKGADTIVRVKRKIQLIIRGNLRTTNQPFQLREVLYISPLSIEQPDSN